MKIRTGFVSNSSSSSFIAVLASNRLDNIDLTASEQAVLEVCDTTRVELEGVEMIVLSFIMGNYDDMETIDMETFAQSVIDHAKKMSDPMIDEYEAELVGAELTAEEKATAKMQISGPAHDWEYFSNVFDNARASIIQKLLELKENKMCVIKCNYF